MKLPIVGRGIPSALFVYETTAKNEYSLIRGTNGSGLLVQMATEVLMKDVVATDWVYVDYLMRCGFEPWLFEKVLPGRVAPITGFSPEMLSTPETFFNESSPPGLVVAPFAAINLGRVIEVVLVLRDRETTVTREDVLTSLVAFTRKDGKDDIPVLSDLLTKDMATRIGATVDIGMVSVSGKDMYLSVNATARLERPKPASRGAPKREVVSKKPIAIDQWLFPGGT